MMKKILVLLIPFFAGVFQAPLVIGGEIIKGKACYRFSDQESIAAARDIALAMAKREALEGYSVFVNATTTVENYTMKNNLITSITAANLNNLKITKKSENLAKREVCRAIQAEVDPIEIKEQVAKRVILPNIPTSEMKFNIPTGLWETDWVKWLKVEDIEIDGSKYWKIRFMCKKNSDTSSDDFYKNNGRDYRVSCADDDGLPTKLPTENSITDCVGSLDLKEENFFYYPPLETFCRDALEGSTKYSFEWLN